MRPSGLTMVPVHLQLRQPVEIRRVDDKIASILTSDCVDIDCVRLSFMKTHWATANARLAMTFVNNHNSDMRMMCVIFYDSCAH
ncbi:hypothetical protein TNCV_3015071 [Trichonephila clavipes]|nr:hypothetical protein TNCV_3015071 [Trichonephila clavipes]